MSILRDDAQKVLEALSALEAHDRRVMEITTDGPMQHSTETWFAMKTERRRLSAVLEERAGILARIALRVEPVVEAMGVSKPWLAPVFRTCPVCRKQCKHPRGDGCERCLTSGSEG